MSEIARSAATCATAPRRCRRRGMRSSGRWRPGWRWSTSSSATCSGRGSTSRCRSLRSASAFDEGLSASTDRRSAAGRAIQDSDMLLIPDPSSAILDPAAEAPTISLVCEIADPITRTPYVKDPRGVARRAEEHLRASGIPDTVFGPECEFFVFDDVHYDLAPNHSHYFVDSAEGYWNSGKPESRIHRAGGEVLSGRTLGLAPRPPYGDGADARADRHPLRVPSSRGRLRQSLQDLRFHDAHPHGRSGHDLQVRQ